MHDTSVGRTRGSKNVAYSAAPSKSGDMSTAASQNLTLRPGAGSGVLTGSSSMESQPSYGGLRAVDVRRETGSIDSRMPHRKSWSKS